MAFTARIAAAAYSDPSLIRTREFMADDPYDVLGVSRGASDDEIRRAYLKLVKELHPDVNPAKSAEERFKKVTSAHDILGDPERRKQFDRGEIDASGEPRRQAYRPQGAGRRRVSRAGGAFEDFGDVFSDFFSGGFQGGGARAISRPAVATCASRSTSSSPRRCRAPRSA